MSEGELITLSDDEMVILSTAMACLVNDNKLTKITADAYNPEMTTYKFFCCDAKRRKMRRKNLILLLAKIAGLAGHKGVGEDAQIILKEMGLV